MRPLLAIAAAALAGCNAVPESGGEIDRAAAQLTAATDPAGASAIATGLARGGCAGLRRAIAALDRSQISGRLLSGLVDDAVAAAGEAGCASAPATRALDGDGAAFQLARARILTERPAEALAQLVPAASEPAVRLRRAEILAALDRPAEALPELEAFLARVPDDSRARAARVEGLIALGRSTEALAAAGEPPHRDATSREAKVAALAAAGRLDAAAAAVATAPLPERPALARRAAALAPAAAIDRFASLSTVHGGVELLAALADRLEAERGAEAALPLRERAARAAPARAELADALARALAAAGRIDAALAAWDRAAAAAPAAPAYRLAPIRALARAGLSGRARTRAMAAVARARRARAADELVVASSAAAAAGDAALAARLAHEARAARPGDGRLAFLVGERLAEAGDRAGAAEVWFELLVCGAHGRAWHRHEVAGRLVGLADGPAAARTVARALSARLPCPAADPDGLASYLDGARNQIEAIQGTQKPSPSQASPDSQGR